MKFWTATGSEYEIRPDSEEPRRNRVRRISPGEMRRDDEWLMLLNNPTVKKGYGVTMILEPLGAGDVTFRTTSAVVRIEKEEAA